MTRSSEIVEFCHALWQQRFRTLSTLFGIAWGTFSLVLLLSFGRGLELNLQERAKGLGQSIVIAWPQTTTKSFAGLPKGRPLRIRAEDIMKLPLQIPDLHSISAEYQDYDRLQFRGKVHVIRLSGVYPSFAQLRTMSPQPGGRFLNPKDMTQRRRVVFLGNQIKKEIFGSQPAVGQDIRIRGMPFKVVGVLEPKLQDSDYGGLDENRVYLPATTHAQLFNRPHISDFVFRAKDGDAHKRVLRQVFEVLGRLYRFDPNDRVAISIWDTTEDNRIFAYFFLGFNTILAGSGSLTLLIGGIGVANLMYIRVKQQTREIAIQMAVGARPARILRQVLGQTLVVVATGGGIGILLALAIIFGVRDTPATAEIGNPVLSPALTIGTLLFLILVGLLAGYVPARRAAQVEPAIILSEE